MSGTDATPMPIIELKASEDEPPAKSHALDRRIRQQEILAELGVTALATCEGGGVVRRS
jgi:hypothetical protein